MRKPSRGLLAGKTPAERRYRAWFPRSTRPRSCLPRSIRRPDCDVHRQEDHWRGSQVEAVDRDPSDVVVWRLGLHDKVEDRGGDPCKEEDEEEKEEEKAAAAAAPAVVVLSN